MRSKQISKRTVRDAVARMPMRFMPHGLRFAVTRALSNRPARPPIAPHEAEAMVGATRSQFGPDRAHSAWTWGAGPNVILVHGWGGRAAQMAPLAAHLAEHGFRSIAYDVSGHGESRLRETRWEWFIRDVALLAKEVGDVYALVGHSAGGLAMMASRRVNALQARRYVCICAPSHPYPPIRGIRQRLDPGERVLERYRRYLGSQFQSTWEALEAGAAFENAGTDLLLCYDEKDRFVDHSQGDRIHALCPGSTLVKTRHHGHARILAASEVMQTVSEFLHGAS